MTNSLGTYLRLDRRRFLAVAAGLVASGVLPRSALALADPFTATVGSFTVRVISDGTLMLPAAIVAPDAPPEMLRPLIEARVAGENFQFAENVVLLEAGERRILIDAGSGPSFQETAGKLPAALTEAGIDPASITDVILTHAHPDHLWGVTNGNGLAFANAAYHIGQEEWDFWTTPGLEAQFPEEMRWLVPGTQGSLGAIAERTTRFGAGAEVLPGIHAIATPGHTPGHVSIRVDGGAGLVVTADTVPTTEVHFAHPDWRFGFDAIPDLAMKSRRAILDLAATDGAAVIGYHWVPPGFGHVERRGDAFAFVA